MKVYVSMARDSPLDLFHNRRVRSSSIPSLSNLKNKQISTYMARLNKFSHTCNNFHTTWSQCFIYCYRKVKTCTKIKNALHNKCSVDCFVVITTYDSRSHFGVAHAPLFCGIMKHHAWSTHHACVR